MPDHGHHLYDFFQSSWRRCTFVSEWICKSASSILQSIVVGTPVSHSLSKFIAEDFSQNSSSLDMDIIEINSSESEEDFEIGDSGVEDTSISDGDIDDSFSTSERLTGQNHELGMNLQLNPYSNNVKRTAQNLHGEENPAANFASHQHQRRILPPSLQRTRSIPESNLGMGSHGKLVMYPQDRQPERLKSATNERSVVELNNTPKDRRKLDTEPSQHTQRRTLPYSLEPTSSRTSPEGAVHYQGGSRIHSWPQATRDCRETNVADSKFYTEDDAGKKNDGFPYGNTDKRRVLPPSIINGKSVSSTQAKAFADSRGNGWNPEARSNAEHRFPLTSENRKLITTEPKTSTVGRDEKGGRVLPPSLIHGKFVNGFQPTGVSGDGNRFGPGGERYIEQDERAIYEEAVQTLRQPKSEENLPDGILLVSLLKHQKIALAWMNKRESSHHCAGGILADDQGLGKTISTIALVQMQMTMQYKFTSDDSICTKSEALNLDEDDDGVVVVDKTQKCEQDDLKIGKGDHKRNPMPSSSTNLLHNRRPSAGTLVVCPASLLRQWARELDEKVADAAKLSVLVYHGGTRTKNPGDLAKYDVVLTTYSIVTNEVPKQNRVDDDDDEQKNVEQYGLSSDFSTNKKRKQNSNAHGKKKKKKKGLKDSHFDIDSGTLARVRWFRVVLDEAQTIKNHRTQVARACCGLRAQRRWCLSGTPIQNSIDDLYSYFRFLKYYPYDDYKTFCPAIKFPISRNTSHGFKKLRAVLDTILLRRTKDTLLDGEPVVKLPPKSVSLKKVGFSPGERAFYLRLEANSRQQFKEYAAAGTVKQNYASILVMLLRLRQACDHPLLVKDCRSDTVEKHSLGMARQLPREMLTNLLFLLDSLSICRLCNDPPEDAVVTMCGHVFCYQCVSDRLSGDDNQCPVTGCKEILGADVVFTRATLNSCIYDDSCGKSVASTSAPVEEPSSITESSYVSSKIRAVIDILNSISNQSSEVGSKACNETDLSPNGSHDPAPEGSHFEYSKTISGHVGSDPKIPVKTIIFSQWTGMLDLLEISLNHSLIQYRRLDGSMSLNSRDIAVRDFNNDPEVTVMIMSLKAGNLGLNMTSASHVILLDLWWNPSAEDQAVDRAHRIGQTRTVTVSRLTISDTVEDRILALQEEKRKLVSSAFGEDQKGSHATRLTMEDLRYLFMI